MAAMNVMTIGRPIAGGSRPMDPKAATFHGSDGNGAAPLQNPYLKAAPILAVAPAFRFVVPPQET